MPVAAGAGGLGGYLLRQLVASLFAADSVGSRSQLAAELANTCPTLLDQIEYLVQSYHLSFACLLLAFGLGSGFALGLLVGYCTGAGLRFATGSRVRFGRPGSAGLARADSYFTA